MSELRDARLQRALQSADEELHGPSELARRSVLRIAREAVAVQAPWWQRVWRSPETGVPLRAALTSVLLAGFVALLWYDKPMPGSSPQRAAPRSPAPAPAPAPAPVPESVPAPAPPPPVMPPPLEVVPEPAPARAIAPRPRPAPRPQAPVDTEPAAPAPAPEPAAAPTPTPTPPVTLEPVAPPRVPAVQRPRAQWEDWSEARVEAGNRGVGVAREQAFHLSELLYRVIGAPADSLPFQGLPAERVALMTRGLTTGVLELGAEQARWTPVGEPSRTLRPDPQALQALRAEAQRLAGR